jgi:ATP-dependent helicase/nuclease subunit B
VFQDWQGWLAAQGLSDIGARRVAALDAQTRAWTEAPPRDPVIVAGIGAGGTIPAAARLLRVVAGLPQGAIILHGLPDAEEEAVWQAIAAAPTHPLHGSAALLAALAADRRDLAPWPGDAPRAHPERATLLARALRPPEGIAAWRERAPARWRDALADLSRLAASDPPQEAAAIALLLRETLEHPGARAALVTPDRDLARRVSAALARHGVTADDSAGEPLMESEAGAFLRLLAQMVAERFAPVPLLACLKHRLAAGGMPRAAWLREVRRLERAVLRGPRPAAGLAGLRAALGAVPEHAPLHALLDRLEARLGDFATLSGEKRAPADLLAAHLAAAERLAATDDTDGPLRLYAGEEGEPLAEHLAGLAEAMDALPPVAPEAWAALFDAAMEGPLAPSVRAVRGRDRTAHPRIAILGLLEARLLSFDRVILGALEEGVWPQATDPGPWMSRPMRAAFGLPSPEARIGRVAADFLHLASATQDVVLSAAARRGGSPATPARWLTRLETFLAGQQDLALPRSAAADWAAGLDRPERLAPWPRPAPRPPAAVRPRLLTVSDATLLIADPYAFYAKRVLRLAPLEALDEDPGARDYGNLVHDALKRFLDALGTGWPGMAEAGAAWRAAAAEALRRVGPRPGLVAFWRPRLLNIGRFVVAEEAALRHAGRLAAVHAEIEGRAELDLPGGRVTITARADRIDLLEDGAHRLLDYKTGSPPTAAQLRDGRAPQLPIEALILAAGGFPQLAPPQDAGARFRLVYWQLTGGEVAGQVKDLTEGRSAVNPAEMLADARERLADLASRFLLGEAAFTARPHPKRAPKGDDYAHLARIEEWGVEEGA